MNKMVWSITLTLFISAWLTLSFAQQAARPTSNSQTLERELTVMKEIIRTRLSFLDRTGDDRLVHRIGGHRPDAFYLHGQGAVFVLPTHHPFVVPVKVDLQGLFESIDQFAPHVDALQGKLQESQLRLMEQQVKMAERAAARAERELEGVIYAPAAVAVVPPLPYPAPSKPAAAESSSPEQSEKLKQKAEELKSRAKKAKEELEARQQDYQEQMRQLEGELVHILAQYGNTLTQIPSNEYINIIIQGTSRDLWHGHDSEANQRVLTARKSDVLEHSSGRINLEEFRQRVQIY